MAFDQSAVRRQGSPFRDAEKRRTRTTTTRRLECGDFDPRRVDDGSARVVLNSSRRGGKSANRGMPRRLPVSMSDVVVDDGSGISHAFVRPGFPAFAVDRDAWIVQVLCGAGRIPRRERNTPSADRVEGQQGKCFT